jgi:D-3-phosphoglycerate dehydrogenase / 2-oxoglutarate reductase
MNKILITTSSFGKNDPSPLEKIHKAGYDSILNPFGRKLTEREISNLVYTHAPQGILAGVEPLTRKVLSLGRKKGLKAIARAGIGMDSVDIDAANEMGISVTNTPDAPTTAVAELTLGMILTVLRKIHISDASIRKNCWERPMGNLLAGKTVGIIGCGRIGSKLASYLIPFECKILGCDTACSFHERIEITDLDKLLGQSDIVSLHLPYCPQTHHFMNNKRILSMQKGAFLINTARGELIHEQSLVSALVDGHLAGAALDCFEREPYIGQLKELDNVLLSAHIGSYARESRIMMEMQAAKNIISQLSAKG